MELQERLKQEGLDYGMCDKFADSWDNPDQNELCAMYLRGLDFCIKHNWPSYEFIKKNFDNNVLVNNGIIVRNGLYNAQRCVVVLGDTYAEIQVPDFGVSSIYALNNSSVKLSIGENASVYITIHHNASVEVYSKGSKSKVMSSVYGGNIINKEKFDKITNK